MVHALIYVLIFLGLQAGTALIVQALWKVVTGSSDLTTAQLITTTAAFSVATLVVFLWSRWAELSPRWLRTRQWMTLSWAVVAALGVIIPALWLQEQMPELPNLIEEQFGMILTTPWGYVAVGLLAPFAEEVVFRGAVLRQLLTTRLTPLAAVSVSALLFALAHLNPAQMPHAFLVGLLLGWMYWRTGSILPGMAYHWANNSVAYLIAAVYPNPDIRLVDIFQGSTTHVYLALLFSLLILLPSLYQLHIWMRRAE